MKYKSHLITSACIAVLAFGGSSVAFAASKKAAAPAAAPSASTAPAASAAPAAKGPHAIPFHGNATAVDKKAKTFTLKGVLTSRVLKVTDQTVVTKMGAPAKFVELTENEAVTGSYWKKEDGSLEAKSLKIGGKSEAEKEAAAAAKAKKEAKKAAAEPAADAAASPAPKKK